MPLQLDVHVVAAEDADEPIEQAADAVTARARAAARPASATSPPTWPSSSSSVSAPSPFRRAQLHARDQPAQVPIALGGLDRGRAADGCDGRGTWRDRASDPAVALHVDRQLGADDGLDPGGARGLVEARRAVDAVAIEQRHRGVSEIGRAIDERFGQRRALEKAEGRGGVELDIHSGLRATDSGLRAVRSRAALQCGRTMARLTPPLKLRRSAEALAKSEVGPYRSKFLQ